jgi:plasmid maintenance system killer protein
LASVDAKPPRAAGVPPRRINEIVLGKRAPEALKHDRKGRWSIRIDDQWRVCFRFEGGDAFDVEITDYH